jgi:hypothetical protein
MPDCPQRDASVGTDLARNEEHSGVETVNSISGVSGWPIVTKIERAVDRETLDTGRDTSLFGCGVNLEAASHAGSIGQIARR